MSWSGRKAVVSRLSSHVHRDARLPRPPLATREAMRLRSRLRKNSARPAGSPRRGEDDGTRCAAELGDIDVLAWRNEREILLIEWQAPATRTYVAEIVEICNVFRGESKDELHRQMERVNWVGDHLDRLEPIVGFHPLGRPRHKVGDQYRRSDDVPEILCPFHERT